MSDFNPFQSFKFSLDSSFNIFLTTFFASSIKSSDSLTYTNPLEIISGPETTLPSFVIVITTIISPSSERCFLSLSTIFPTSPTPRPSTKILPEGTSPTSFASFCEI